MLVIPAQAGIHSEKCAEVNDDYLAIRQPSRHLLLLTFYFLPIARYAQMLVFSTQPAHCRDTVGRAKLRLSRWGEAARQQAHLPT